MALDHPGYPAARAQWQLQTQDSVAPSFLGRFLVWNYHSNYQSFDLRRLRAVKNWGCSEPAGLPIEQVLASVRNYLIL